MSQAATTTIRGTLHPAGIDGPIIIRSLLVTAVVGMILNVIGNYDMMVTGGTPDPVKLILTCMVPTAVAAAPAAEARLTPAALDEPRVCRAADGGPDL